MHSQDTLRFGDFFPTEEQAGDRVGCSMSEGAAKFLDPQAKGLTSYVFLELWKLRRPLFPEMPNSNGEWL